jgi:hypothetical protein
MRSGGSRPCGDQASSIADRIRSSSPGYTEAYVESVIDGDLGSWIQ